MDSGKTFVIAETPPGEAIGSTYELHREEKFEIERFRALRIRKKESFFVKDLLIKH